MADRFEKNRSLRLRPTYAAGRGGSHGTRIARRVATRDSSPIPPKPPARSMIEVLMVALIVGATTLALALFPQQLGSVLGPVAVFFFSVFVLGSVWRYFAAVWFRQR